MEASENGPRKPDTGPSLAAIAALQELRQFAIAQRKPLEQASPVHIPNAITHTQLHTLVESAGKLRGNVIYKSYPGKKTKDGKTIHEDTYGPFRITSIDDEGARKKDSRILIVANDDGQSPAITLTFYATIKGGHEFNLHVNFGDHPEIDKDEPLTYDSGRKKREEMDTAEYDVLSDLLTRAEKVFPNHPI